MILCIADVLSSEALTRIRETLAATAFRDGRETAGWHARTVKRNEQADARRDEVQAIRGEVDEAIASSTLFQMAARPRRTKPVLFSRYEPGMDYGAHVDDAVMGAGGEAIRTDIAFTLFLSEPESYDGGELVTDTTAGEQHYKLPAGSMVIYPASTLHWVAPLSRGERLAAVGWCQSQVRDPGQREVLFDLDTTRRRIFNEQGKTADFDAVSKSVANLLRMWAEI